MSDLQTKTVTITVGANDHQGQIGEDNNILLFDSSVTSLIVSNWAGTPPNTSAFRAAYEFSLGLPVNASNGFLIEPPVFQSLTLNLVPISGNIGTVQPWIVNQTQPAAFDITNTNFPGPDTTFAVAPFTGIRRPHLPAYKTNITSSVDGVSFVGGGTGTTITSADLGNVVSIPLDPVVVNRLVRDEGGTAPWNNTLYIVLVAKDEWLGVKTGSPRSATSSIIFAASTHASFPAPTLTMTYTDFHTGHRTQRTDAHRTVHDARLGLPIASTDAVEDGRIDGLYVQPWDIDPDDPSEKHQAHATPEAPPDNKPIR